MKHKYIKQPGRAFRKANIKLTKVSEEAAARVFEAALAKASKRLLSNHPFTAIRRRPRPKLVWTNPNLDHS